MITARHLFILTVVCLSALTANAQLHIPTDVGCVITKEPTLVPSDELPTIGTFWLAYPVNGLRFPPLPFIMQSGDVYDIGNGQYLIDNDETSSALSHSSATMMASLPVPGGGSGGGGTTNSGPLPDTRRNVAKYMDTVFTFLIDTNDVAGGNPQLYNVLASMPQSTNFAANLQIAPYGTNSVVIKANHFDYSADYRDFALIICDRLDAPIWKAIDLAGASDSVDGWLIEGTVPNWQVTDPMYFNVQNLPANDNAFFSAIPYLGPNVLLGGQAPGSTVVGSISLTATITDLSGTTTTNEQLSMNVDGLPAYYTLSPGNVITLDTRYSPDGWANIYLNLGNGDAQVYNPTNLPDNQQLIFSSTGAIGYDFENPTYLAFASDMCPLVQGTNQIEFYISEAQNVSAQISDPSNGIVVATYSGYMPAGYIAIPWNFTENDGVTSYSNSTYSVTFNALGTTLKLTNTIDKALLRPAGSCLLSYQWEDPYNSDGITLGPGWTLDTEAVSVIDGSLVTLFQNLYYWAGLTQYWPDQVGATNMWQRVSPACYPYTPTTGGWVPLLSAITNQTYSELTIAEAHGSSIDIGGGSYLTNAFTIFDLQRAVATRGCGPNWRLRRAALWACFTGASNTASAGGVYSDWAAACGIRPTALQVSSLMYKNCGLFFGGKLPQFFGSTIVPATTADVAEFVDQVWVCGPNQYPGGCNPNYSYLFAIRSAELVFPSITNAAVSPVGFPECVYNAGQDANLRVGNTGNVFNN